jgi:hypothetical protein
MTKEESLVRVRLNSIRIVKVMGLSRKRNARVGLATSSCDIMLESSMSIDDPGGNVPPIASALSTLCKRSITMETFGIDPAARRLLRTSITRTAPAKSDEPVICTIIIFCKEFASNDAVRLIMTTVFPRAVTLVNVMFEQEGSTVSFARSTV